MMNTNSVIIYEQPTHELMRVYLRLEHLFQRLMQQKSSHSPLSIQAQMTTLVHILNTLDRPDFKAKLTSEISQHIANLVKHEHSPGIDQDILRNLLTELESLYYTFINISGKIAQKLRENDFIGYLRSNLTNPTGCCHFDVPSLHYWLNQTPREQQQETIDSWLTTFDPLKAAITLILRLIRESVDSHQRTAKNGLHQESLDPNTNYRLIRIAIDGDIKAHPEISVGRHRVSIRFARLDVHKRSTEYTDPLTFQLSCCYS